MESNQSSPAPLHQVVGRVLDEISRPMVLNDFERCMICSKPVVGYKAEYCCSGSDCGCHGMPIHPCLCSDRCAEALYDINGSFEDRRIRHGIAMWDGDAITPNPKAESASGDKP